MFHFNAIILIFCLISSILNLIKCDKDNAILNKKKLNCCSCANSDCINKNSVGQANNLFQNKDNIQIVNRRMDGQSREEEGLLDAETANNPRKHFKLDVSSSIRDLVNQLRPQSPLAAFGLNAGASTLNRMTFAPITNGYNYRPVGINYGGLDIAPAGYSDFTPFISPGLGSSLGTPYGTGLGIGSSFGIYDNYYPNTMASIGTSKSTLLRRKLVPSEGVLLLEVEDTLNDGLSHETFALNRNSFANMALNRNQDSNSISSASSNSFGRPKFSIQLTSSNAAKEFNNYENTEEDLLYSNRLPNHHTLTKQLKPNLTKENLINLEELSKNPHLNKISQLNPYKSIKIFKS